LGKGEQIKHRGGNVLLEKADLDAGLAVIRERNVLDIGAEESVMDPLFGRGKPGRAVTPHDCHKHGFPFG